MSKEQLPSDAAIKEALRRADTGYEVSDVTYRPSLFSELILAARLIEKHEPETLVDPYLRRARELLAEAFEDEDASPSAAYARKGDYDECVEIKTIIRALKEGMGK